MSSIQPPPVIDLACLARFTGGDPASDAEILSLFARESANLVQQLETARLENDAATWRRVTHSLKGAARGVGAGALADAAAKAEPLQIEKQPHDTAAAVHLLKGHAEAIGRFVAAHLAGMAA